MRPFDMRRYGLTLVAVAATLALAACARPSATVHLLPVAPGLLDGQPIQQPGTYRVVGWVVADQTGAPVAGARIMVPGTAVATETDAYGRYLLPNLPADRDTIVVRMLGYAPERRVLSRQTPIGLHACPADGCGFSFTDTLNFWLHRSPLRIGIVPLCGLTIVALDERAKDCSLRSLLSDSLASELGR
jgi:hypothetical protein